MANILAEYRLHTYCMPYMVRVSLDELNCLAEPFKAVKRSCCLLNLQLFPCIRDQQAKLRMQAITYCVVPTLTVTLTITSKRELLNPSN